MIFSPTVGHAEQRRAEDEWGMDSGGSSWEWTHMLVLSQSRGREAKSTGKNNARVQALGTQRSWRSRDKRALRAMDADQEGAAGWRGSQ